MNDATLPWTVFDLILFFKQQKIKDLHFFLNWYRYLCCELVKLNFDGTVPFLPVPAHAKISGSTTMAAKIKRIGSRQVASLHCTGMQCC